ncbi:potassium channel family protein [bacterium]|nr:potassium channel family protein [bacterium]
MSTPKSIFNIRKKVKSSVKKRKEVWLLAALTLFLLIPIPVTFFPEHFQIIFVITYSLLIIGGIKSVADSRRHVVLAVILGVLSFIFVWISLFYEPGHTVNKLRGIFLLLFFLFLAYHVFQSLALFGEVSFNTIFSSISGYLIIGVIGGLLFQLLELSFPGSFNFPNAKTEFLDLNYFSFITLTTIGFGDITPDSRAARSLTIVVGIAGQLYLTILVAILVGKFITSSKK